MPGKPHFALNKKVWFLNDIWYEGDITMGDFVNVEDKLEHLQYDLAEAKKFAIHDKKFEVHTVNQSGRRRMPHGPHEVTEDPDKRPTFKELMNRNPNKYTDRGEYQPWAFPLPSLTKHGEFFPVYNYLTDGLATTYTGVVEEGASG